MHGPTAMGCIGAPSGAHRPGSPLRLTPSQISALRFFQENPGAVGRGAVAPASLPGLRRLDLVAPAVAVDRQTALIDTPLRLTERGLEVARCLAAQTADASLPRIADGTGM